MAVKRRCFVAIPFGDRDDPERIRSEFVLNRIIGPALSRLGYEAKPVTQQIGSITQTILTEIASCDLVIADLTDSDPNVFYELAFAHTIYKPTILLIERDQRKNLPFDVKDQNTVAYDYSLKESKKELMKKALKTKERIKLLARRAREKTFVFSSPISQLLPTEKILDLVIASLGLVGAAKYTLNTLYGLLQLDKARSESLIRGLKTCEPEFHYAHDEICQLVYGSPRSRLINDFVIYCNECRIMIERAEKSDGIGVLTVQTPFQIDMDESFKRAYNDYIDASIKKIVNSRIRYRRLAVIREESSVAHKRVVKFLRKLIRRALKVKRKTLDNVWIGFVRLESALDSLCSNIDFHITSEKEFSLAFLSTTLKRQFGESIHVLDAEKYISERIRQNVYRMWSQTNVKTFQLTRKYYSLDKSYSDMMDKLEKDIAAIVKEMTAAS